MHEFKQTEFHGLDGTFAKLVLVTRKHWDLKEVLAMAGLPADVKITHTDDDGHRYLDVEELDVVHESRTDEAGVPLVKVQKSREVTRLEFYDEYEPVVSSGDVGQPSESLSCGSVASP